MSALFLLVCMLFTFYYDFIKSFVCVNNMTPGGCQYYKYLYSLSENANTTMTFRYKYDLRLLRYVVIDLLLLPSFTYIYHISCILHFKIL